jgi:hypothetical protein
MLPEHTAKKKEATSSTSDIYPSWESLYEVIKVVFGKSYMLEMLQGDCLPKAINERYLKEYFPSV